MDRLEKEQELLGILRRIAPGTPLRSAIDDIAKAKLGALIVVGNSQEILNVVNGGFEVNCKFTPQKLVELCKMDGAVVLDDDIKKIIFANTLLVPNHNIPTNETGTRHKAAERTAKQTGNIVIAVSERKGKITVYSSGIRYVLRDPQEILHRAGETLRMLEKHKEIFNELLMNLNVLEFTNLVSLNDVVLVLQRLEIISRMDEIIRKYVLELGTEGSLVKMQLKEIKKGLDNEGMLILKDYSRREALATKILLSELSLDELIEPMNIVKILGYNELNDRVVTRGFRILSKTDMAKEDVEALIQKLEYFHIISESKEAVEEVIGREKAEMLMQELSLLKEQAMLGKKI